MATPRRDLGDVLDAAFALLDEEGLDALTLRAVARRLDAHLNTVSFQVKTKARLLELMADAVLAQLSLADLPEPPVERVREIAARYRAALLSRRDGARLVAGTSVFDRHTLTIGEAIIQALLDAGLGGLEATRVFWGVAYLTLGLTQEEQDASPGAADRLREALATGDYPAIASVAGPLVDDGFENRFHDGITRLLVGIDRR